jgi:hypothetical protein
MLRRAILLSSCPHSMLLTLLLLPRTPPSRRSIPVGRARAQPKPRGECDRQAVPETHDALVRSADEEQDEDGEEDDEEYRRCLVESVACEEVDAPQGELLGKGHVHVSASQAVTVAG